jgi:hypothetical protein
MTVAAPPPRLHVLMRPETDQAVVLRRGGTRVFCSIGWDRSRDTFAVGQWCKHKLYPQRCDISPDGRWLVYFALNGRWRSETLGAWTAVSFAPYLRAVRIWPLGNTWGGGGLLHGDRARLPPGSDWDRMEVIDERTRLGSGTYVERLRRDGWRHDRGDGASGKAFEKPFGTAWVLRKKVHGEQREWHQLRAPDGAVVDRPGWEWAEVDERRRRIVWAEAGALYAARIRARGLGDPQLLFDARAMTFTPIKAPYDTSPAG